MQIKKLLLGTFIGAIILQIWSSAFWYSPIGQNMFLSFEENEKVMQVIKENAPENGMYMIMQDNFFMYSSVDIIDFSHEEEIAMDILYTFVYYLIASFFITWLLLRTKINTYLGRLSFVIGIAVIIISMTNMADMVWWEFSPLYTMFSILNILMGMFLLGLFLAWICKPANE